MEAAESVWAGLDAQKCTAFAAYYVSTIHEIVFRPEFIGNGKCGTHKNTACDNEHPLFGPQTQIENANRIHCIVHDYFNWWR